jgi:hypothetical protein
MSLLCSWNSGTACKGCSPTQIWKGADATSYFGFKRETELIKFLPWRGGTTEHILFWVRIYFKIRKSGAAHHLALSITEKDTKQSCQIFLGTTYQNGKNIQNVPNGHKKPFGRKIDIMATKNTNIFHCNTFQNLPKLIFLVRKFTIWQH